MISRFFIDRPIFASVLSILVTLAGSIALFALPIAQYPPITPPTVQVSCNYPGASARTVADTIAAPIEQQVNGVEGMLYMSSQCGNDGSYNLTVTFDLGTDLNTALVMVQNRVSLATPQLPESVQKQGLTIKKKTPNILLVINFFSPDGRYDDTYLSNYATISVKDEIFRLPGVGDIVYLGERDYSVRAWLDPQKMAARQISATDVANAVKNQNQAAAPGTLGQQPAPDGQVFATPTDALGRLTTPEQFGNIIVKSVPGDAGRGETSKFVRLKDIARLELAASNYNQAATVDGMPSVALAIYQLPGTNALDVANGIRKKLDELRKRFPEGLDAEIYYDTTPFIRDSVADVVKTLLEAIALVAIVVLVFLQNWRAALIPLIAVPVAIIGTFAVMAMIGFSLNNISLFGLVLAIGIVVDDAIVVVENVERWLEQGLPPKEAARKAMDEVTGPVVAVAVVLCAVFTPCAFIPGITGEFFRQFAVTIAVSTVFSAMNSLTLSPVLAALLLKPHHARPDLVSRLLNFTLGWFFRLFNWVFERGTNAYGRVVGWSLRLAVLVLLLYGGLLGATGWMFSWYPTGFIPLQDQGWLLVNVQLPDSASVQETEAVMARVDQIARKIPGVAHTVGVSGQSILLTSNSSNFGSMFVVLDPFAKRKKPGLTANDIQMELRKKYYEVTDAQIGVFSAPPVPGIGVASGFKLMVEDRGSLGLKALEQNADDLIGKIREQRGFIMVSTQFRANAPQLYMDIDRTKARSLGVSVKAIDQALQVYLGAFYVNNFNEFGRYWQVNLQAEGEYRNKVRRDSLLTVRNGKGDMVPISTIATFRDDVGPVMITRYNLYETAPVNGIIIPPVSSGQGISIVDNLSAETLPKSMNTEWTDLTFMQIRAGNTAMYVFALAVVFVFLALAALYESWSLPLAVILVVPMCLLCSLVGIMMRRLAMDIFVQIGFVVLVGLACKNAILIVEFARQLRVEGKARFEATVEACRMRLRPILMTSFAFILGVVPMVVAGGAGAEMRWSLGTAVFSGMLGVTLFGIFLTPVFFYVIDRLGEGFKLKSPAFDRVLAAALGATAGAAAGYLASRMEAGLPPWVFVVAGAAALAAMADRALSAALGTGLGALAGFLAWKAGVKGPAHWLLVIGSGAGLAVGTLVELRRWRRAGETP